MRGVSRYDPSFLSGDVRHESYKVRIREAMRRAGVTQGQVAEACGVSGPAVNQVRA